MVSKSQKQFSLKVQWNSFEALQKCHIQKMSITITCYRVPQTHDLGQSNYKLMIFSKRTHNISKIIFIYDLESIGIRQIMASI